MQNILRLMTTRLVRMASKAFESNIPEIPEVGFGRMRGSKPRIVGTMAVPSCTDDGVGPAIAGNARTRGENPSMAGGACSFSESDGPESADDSMISLMTTKDGGTEVVSPRRFFRYSS